jgi:hypothetical protein
LPDVALKHCKHCNKIFHADDYELHYLQKNQCLFCRSCRSSPIFWSHWDHPLFYCTFLAKIPSFYYRFVSVLVRPPLESFFNCYAINKIIMATLKLLFSECVIHKSSEFVVSSLVKLYMYITSGVIPVQNYKWWSILTLANGKWWQMVLLTFSLGSHDMA